MGRVVHGAYIDEMNLHRASGSKVPSLRFLTLRATVMVVPGCPERFFSLILISDRNRSMLSASSVSAATSFMGELDLEDPLRSFAPDAGKKVNGTHQDAEPLAPIVCVASSLQPMIEFPAISEQFSVQHESP